MAEGHEGDGKGDGEGDSEGKGDGEDNYSYIRLNS